MKTSTLLAILVAAAAPNLLACEADCEAKLSCGVYPNVGGEGGVGGVADGGGGAGGIGGDGGMGGAGGSQPVALVGGGRWHSCVARVDGIAQCWGDNSKGQLGDGSVAATSEPVDVATISNVKSLVGGDLHTCGLLVDGSVHCWGNNVWGQLGNGTANDSSFPLAVFGQTSAVILAGGIHHTCSILEDGSAWCWGRGNLGQVGNGTWFGSPSPGAVQGITDAVHIAAGDAHSCLVRAGGQVLCWGDDKFAQLGKGTTDESTNAPIPVPGLTDAIAVSSGTIYTCALHSNGTVSCWGSNSHGQLGCNSSASLEITPQQVVGITNIVAIAAGGAHSCALDSTGSVWCWGTNTNGELGTGQLSEKSATPVKVVGLPNSVSIVSGGAHSCSIAEDGTLHCWGSNDRGQLGYDGPDSSIPVEVQIP